LLRPVAFTVVRAFSSLESNEIPALVDTVTPFPKSDDKANESAAPLVICVPAAAIPEDTPTPAEPDTEISALADVELEFFLLASL
jgi:hypothetical protein